MAARTISSAGLHSVQSGFLDLMGESKSSYRTVKLDDIASTMAYLGAKYAEEMAKALKAADATSSGKLADSFIPLEVEVFGSLYTIKISALKYAQFIDEGVDGWAKSRGSKYKFKTKGVDPNGEMVKSVMAWLQREGSFTKVKLRPISDREVKQNKITDASLKKAITASYMIKRQGIQGKHYLTNATNVMKAYCEKELSSALRVDIINNLN